MGAIGSVLASSMLRYIVRRILWGAFMLVVVSALTFVIFTIFPSADPAALRAGRQATPELIAQIRQNLGLDKPVYVQYWLFLKGIVLHFDLGYSYQNSVSVKSQIFTRLPVTLSLTAGAFVIWMLVAIPIGVISAIRPRSLLDRATMGGALVAISAPVYFLGLIALFLFSSDIGGDPPAAGRRHVHADLGLAVAVVHVAADAVVRPRGRVRRVLRPHGAREPDRHDGRGLHPHRASEGPLGAAGRRAPRPAGRADAGRHAWRGMDIGILLGGAILTETVFNIPGIGRYAYDSIINSDLPAIEGTVLFGAFFIIAANIFVDILYAFLDPRVRY